jgi:tRNA-Thr(GGU) m(6)t(6)A37 methyltransferase TsaA
MTKARQSRSRAAATPGRKRAARTGGATAKRRARDGGKAVLRPVGVLSSTIKSRGEAPKQGEEGAPDAWLEVYGWAKEAMDGLAVGDEILIITWFHRAHRDRMKVHPRSDPKNPLTGVFATRSPDRPNPLGLHPVTLRAIEGRRLRVGPIEAIDGTPVVDIKPVL